MTTDALEVQDIRELGSGWAWFVNDLRASLPAWQDMELASPSPDEPVTQIEADVPIEPLALHADAMDLELDLHSYDCVFPVELQRPNGKNINLHKKWGFSRFQKECRKVREKCGEPHFLCIFCTLFVQKVRFSALFTHFLALFLESAETPLFVQINVFAVWPLRLDRKYTIL